MGDLDESAANDALRELPHHNKERETTMSETHTVRGESGRPTKRSPVAEAPMSEKYVLCDANGEGIALADAPSRFDAEFYGATHLVAEGYRFSRTEAEYRVAHDRLRESFRAKYLAEGHTEVEADEMAAGAAGPMEWPPLVFVERQESALRSPSPGAKGGTR